MRTSFGEFQAGASDEIGDHSGNKNLARRAVRHDASRGVNGDAADIPTSQLDLAGMQTGAQRQADLFTRGFKRQRTPHRAAGPSNVARTPSPVVLIRLPRCFSTVCFAILS
jgi:hypothetical protein